jgi:ADP-heptose:LPS heptosyltransferase
VRVWPLERFRDLVRRLREHGFVVLVACDADQRSWWLAGGETSVSTPQTISELLKLTDGAGVFIGNDSGPGHLEAFNGVPTFTLFGPQLPEWFAPLHPQAAWIEGPICPYRPCSDYCHFPLPHCLWDLDCDTVWREVGAFVARHVDLLSKTTTGTP